MFTESVVLKVLIAAGILAAGLGAAPIHDAAESGDLKRMEELVNRGENINIQNMPYQQRPLHIAVYNEHPEIVALLLKHGADVNARMNNGQTPLFIAAYFGDIESLKMLLDHGAQVNISDHLGNTPLHKAAEGDSAEAVKILLEKGAHIHAVDKEGNTPLHIAGYIGSEKAVWELMGHGARIDLKNNDGNTPPEEAYEEDHVRISKIMKGYKEYVKQR